MLCVIFHLLIPQQNGGPLKATLIIINNEQLFITQTSSKWICKLIDVDTNLKNRDQQDWKITKLKTPKSSLYNEQENQISPIVQNQKLRPFNNPIFDTVISLLSITW
jgi:hypothetical protein